MMHLATAAVTLAFWWVFVTLTDSSVPLAFGWVAAVVLIIWSAPFVASLRGSR